MNTTTLAYFRLLTEVESLNLEFGRDAASLLSPANMSQPQTPDTPVKYHCPHLLIYKEFEAD